MRPASTVVLALSLLAGCTSSRATVRDASSLPRADQTADARAVAASEAALGGRTSGARTLGVLPFESADSTVDDLSFGFAELVQADLGKFKGLRLVERLRMEDLVKEQSLDASRTDPATRARIGRLIAAKQLVHGRIAALGDTGIQFDVVLLSTETSEIGASLVGSARADGLFDAERQVVAHLAAALGLAVPPALEATQRARNGYPAEAFRTFSAGARAEAGGDFEGASASYAKAAATAPSFEVAVSKSESTRQKARDGAKGAPKKAVPRRPARRTGTPARPTNAASTARVPE